MKSLSYGGSREHCREKVVVCAGVSVGELLWVLRGAQLFVGNDSGPTHLAAALGVPTVVLFGSSDAEVWYPWKAPFQRVQNSFDCNPVPRLSLPCLRRAEMHPQHYGGPGKVVRRCSVARYHAAKKLELTKALLQSSFCRPLSR